MVDQITVAVMADIHSNYQAFQSCVQAAAEKGVHRYIFLGDYLGDLAYPQKTIKLMKELQQRYPCIFIRKRIGSNIGEIGMRFGKPALPKPVCFATTMKIYQMMILISLKVCRLQRWFDMMGILNLSCAMARPFK